MARAAHEWRVAARWTVAAVTAIALLQAAAWYVGGDGDTGSLHMWQQKMLWVIGINLLVAAWLHALPQAGAEEPRRSRTLISARRREPTARPRPPCSPSWRG